MKLQRRSFIIIVFFSLTMLAVVFFILDGNRNESNVTAVQTQTPTPIQTSLSIEQVWKPAYGEFMTDLKEPHVLWQKDQKMVYVQDHQLIYTTDGEAKQVLHEWTDSLPAQAWLNGEHLLIGTQHLKRDPKAEEYIELGSLIAVDIGGTKPTVKDLKNIYFGPQEILSVTVAKEPRLFFLKVLNKTGFSEYVFDPSHSEWEGFNSALMNSTPMEMPTKANDLKYFSNTNIFKTPDGPTVYAFHEEEGDIIYYQQPFYHVSRYVGYEMIDAKLMTFLDDSSQMIGRFRNQAGEEDMSFLNYGYSLFDFEPRLWESNWRALNPYTFTNVSANKVEVIQYTDGYSLEDNPPMYSQFLTKESKWISTQGSLVEYEDDGASKYLSLHDLINTKAADPDSLWSSPLKDFTIKKENRTTDSGETFSHKIPQWNFEDHNTNKPIPDELHKAVDKVHRDGDYGHAKTYRKIGSKWFVLVERHFYEFNDGALTKIGEMPITISVTIGEGSGGLGARDFVRMNDSWIVADTEGSRILKLNNKLEIEAELSVPVPYRLTIEKEQLLIDSTANRLTVNSDLKLLNTAPQVFISTVNIEKVMFEYSQTQQLYADTDSGLTWYYLFGSLYQYHAKKQQYRSFYIGNNMNNTAHVKIIPFKDEVIVLLDNRLERFDRTGNWLSSLTFPRSEPDGIYDYSTQGENSLIIDLESNILYLVQGYRILGINLKRNEVNTIFRQNYADIGELIQHENNLYFMLRSNVNDRLGQQQEGQVTSTNMYTEIVKIDLQVLSIRRFLVEGYYDSLKLDANSEKQPTFLLKSYI